MRLYTPDGLLYPITVTKLQCDVGDEVEQNAPLFTYQYKSLVTEGSEENKEGVEVERPFYSTFESEVDGKIEQWRIKEGQIITRPRTEVVDIEEACKHEVQFGGMCANCGKDMTTVAYNTTARNTSRATVNNIHGHTALLVSQAEASRSDEEAKRRLLSSRKLSLVVDLDQTIIQATVDPTIAEWQKDESNPNYAAVKDVRAFQLVDDTPGAKGCWYYIKLRPGLEEFLETMSKYYELHIYTMGTRAYAHNIAKIVDPHGKIFADRILSRDESGSLTAKNLKRLFPVDTKMVVIIDDRGDVWQWIHNLIKVSPYDFFVGIGDINSSFLPKRPELDTKPQKATKAAEGIAIKDHVDSSTNASEKTTESSSTGTAAAATATSKPPQTNGDVSEQLVKMAAGNDSSSLQEKTTQQDETIAAQLADRPLLQKQKMLDEAEAEAKTSPAVEAAVELLTEDGHEKEETSADVPPKYRHNLLQDDDTELEHLGRSLRNVHKAFFDEYDKSNAGSQGGRIAELRPGSKHSKKRSIDELENVPDAALMMADVKAQVLRGVSLVFSGVVPLGVDIQAHDTAIWAKSFGATVSENVTKRTTHVIASPARRTAKVRQAAKRPKIAIVTQAWLLACFREWSKVDEGPFRIHSETPANGDAAGLPGSFDGKDENTVLSSSDEEAALTEEESETPNGFELSINTDVEAELAALAPSLDREDSSPTETELNENWDDINNELDEFLGSEAEESDMESESIKSESTTGLKTPPSQRKRKREEDVAEVDGTDADESDTGDAESRLQKRKKKALARTSSLTNMATRTASAISTPVAVVDPGGRKVAEEEDGEEDDDDLEAALAAEMLKQDDEEEDAA